MPQSVRVVGLPSHILAISAAKRLSLIKQEKDNHVLLEKLNLIEDGKLKRAGFYCSAKIQKNILPEHI